MNLVMTWDEYFIGMLPAIAAKSPDRRCKVGCVIANADRSIVTTGLNGFPRGARHDVEERYVNPGKSDWTSHAELNAILNHARTGGSGLKGCTLYCSFRPCMRCSIAIVQAGISRVVVDRAAHDAVMTDKWIAEFALADVLFEETEINLDWWIA
jgi:dCMP deaminase